MPRKQIPPSLQDIEINESIDRESNGEEDCKTQFAHTLCLVILNNGAHNKGLSREQQSVREVSAKSFVSQSSEAFLNPAKLSSLLVPAQRESGKIRRPKGLFCRSHASGRGGIFLEVRKQAGKARSLIRRFSRLSVDNPDLEIIADLAVGSWMESIMDLSWEQFQNRVCRKCVDGDNKGRCRLPVDESCTLKEFLPEIVKAVSSIHSESIQDYVDALRSHICETCEHQYANGTCWKRDALECALDRFFPIVIEIIESANATEVGAGHALA
jgi:hypothetical protein